MCDKSAPYLNQNSANWALNMVLFYDLMLRFFTKFVPNRTIRECSSDIIFLSHDAKFARNIMLFLQRCKKFVL